MIVASASACDTTTAPAPPGGRAQSRRPPPTPAPPHPPRTRPPARARWPGRAAAPPARPHTGPTASPRSLPLAQINVPQPRIQPHRHLQPGRQDFRRLPRPRQIAAVDRLNIHQRQLPRTRLRQRPYAPAAFKTGALRRLPLPPPRQIPIRSAHAAPTTALSPQTSCLPPPSRTITTPGLRGTPSRRRCRMVLSAIREGAGRRCRCSPGCG